jgi:hypothetical protein
MNSRAWDTTAPRRAGFFLNSHSFAVYGKRLSQRLNESQKLVAFPIPFPVMVQPSEVGVYAPLVRLVFIALDHAEQNNRVHWTK